MNWGTLVATIRSRNQKSASEDEKIKTQICDSIALLRQQRLRFNQGKLAITLTADKGTYVVSGPAAGEATGLPADLLAIKVKRLWLDYNGNADDKQPVHRTTFDELEAMRSGAIVSGAPVAWAFYAGKLELYPPSDLSTSILRGPYVKDIGTPYYTATTADPPVYTFKQPDGTAMADAYTTAWFDQLLGYNIVRFHAEWQLWSGPWQGQDGQGDRAAQKFAEALALCQETTDLQQLPSTVQGWIP